MFTEISNIDNQLFGNKQFVILKIGASWCSSCNIPGITSYFEELYNTYNDKVDFIYFQIDYLDVDDYQEIYPSQIPFYYLIKQTNEKFVILKSVDNSNYKDMLNELNNLFNL